MSGETLRMAWKQEMTATPGGFCCPIVRWGSRTDQGHQLHLLCLACCPPTAGHGFHTCAQLVICAQLVGKTRAILSLGDILLVTKKKYQDKVWSDGNLSAKSVQDTFKALQRPMFFIMILWEIVLLQLFPLVFSRLVKLCVCMRERRKKVKKSVIFNYSCREGPVLVLVFKGRYNSMVNLCSSFRMKIVDERFWFMRPGSPALQITS